MLLSNEQANASHTEAVEESASMATVQAIGLSGNVLAELIFNVESSIGQLKEDLKGKIANDRANIMLSLDGEEPNDAETLLQLGIQAGDVADFTVLVYDVHALARMEIDQMHKEAIERSMGESKELRRSLRKNLVAQRRAQVEREHAEAREREPQGLPLMLTNEATNAKQTGSAQEASAPHAESPLMLSNEPANAAPHPMKDWRVAAAEIAASYDSFFDHISFRKGWKDPPFAKADAMTAFGAASIIAARARIEVLDPRTPGLVLRQVDGSARDWMHSPELATALQEDPAKFVHGLVHATFKDARGYVEGLEESEVDDFIRAFG